MGKRKRVRTVMYADQPIRAAELDLLNTPALQRLHDLRQLGLTDRVFIDASHSRLQHVVGVLEQADKITNAIVRNLKADNTRSLAYGSNAEAMNSGDIAELIKSRRGIIRLIGLLHDLTHAPYGHTVEDEIKLVALKHDHPERQAQAFYRLLCQYIGWLARDAGWPIQADGQALRDLEDFLADPVMARPPDWVGVATLASEMFTELRNDPLCLFWRLKVEEVLSLLGELHAAMTALLHLDLLHKLKPMQKHLPSQQTYPFQALIESILGRCGRPLLGSARFMPQRDAFMLDIVGNTICADLLDYAHRDSHFANIKLAYDTDRIAENFTLVSWDACTYHPREDKEKKERRKPIQGDPFVGPCIRTAISLFTHKLRTDTLGEIMNLLNVRFYLFERVFFNPTKCAADAMLGTALQLLGWRPLLDGETNESELLPDELKYVGDTVFLDSIARAARMVLETNEQTGDPTRVSETLSQVPKSLPALLARAIVRRRSAARNHPDWAKCLDEIRAGLTLVDRLRARRFYRLAFRTLPSTKVPGIDKDARDLAEILADPATRFSVERQIERSTDPPLPLGSVVIHCPEADPARKVADALVVGPDENGDDIIRKVRHIKDVDGEIFGQHQKATEAVSEMYGSMWRLAVYVTPEFLPHHDKLARTAGRVIAEQVQPGVGREWPNDPTLEREIKLRSQQRRQESAANITATEILEWLTETATQLGERGSQLMADRDRMRTLLQRAMGSEVQIAAVKRTVKEADGLDREIINALGARFRGQKYRAVVSEWAAKQVGAIPAGHQEEFIALVQTAVHFTPRDLLAARMEDELPQFLDNALRFGLPLYTERASDGDTE